MSSEFSKSSVENPGITYDRDGIPIDNPELKGLTRYLNNRKIRGRANVAKLTIASICGFYLYKKFRSSGEKHVMVKDEMKTGEVQGQQQIDKSDKQNA